MQIDVEFLKKLQTVINQALKFGEHDSPCDNDEICEHCGSKIHACSLHLNETNLRFNALNSILEELNEKIEKQS